MLVVKLIYMKNPNIFPTVKKLCKSVLKAYSTNPASSRKCKKGTHPYKQLHPWNSKEKFYQHLLDSVSYNKDGLVALNKPCGIQVSPATPNQQSYIPNCVNYTLSDSLSFLAKRLGYSNLIVAQTPEKYSSGVTLLAENETIRNNVKKSEKIALSNKSYPFVYWFVTTKLPKEIRGTKDVGITLEKWKDQTKPIIVHSWTNASLKKKIVKRTHVEFQLLSNSTGNLASLIELKTTARKWNFIKLFAATELYSPILGDNCFGARVHQVMGTWIRTNAFSPAADLPPKLQADLMSLLNVKKNEQEIIPPHVHLRQIILPQYGPNGSDLKIEASLPAYFVWTCKQLEFNTKKIECPELSIIDDNKNNDEILIM